MSDDKFVEIPRKHFDEGLAREISIGEGESNIIANAAMWAGNTNDFEQKIEKWLAFHNRDIRDEIAYDHGA